MRPVCEMREMDICASSASLLEEELASAIEPAVKAAVLSVISALAKFVDNKCAVFHLRLDERDKEFESVRLRLEIAESELKAVRERECTNTADKNFTHSLTNTDEQYCGTDINTDVTESCWYCFPREELPEVLQREMLSLMLRKGRRQNQFPFKRSSLTRNGAGVQSRLQS
ncbi:hypothetical protein HHUSO_G34406 [Huso huso]|uniref:Uncharacterized protein n=1 Tax=Huso huso TaxID=61971 RepID=A0ABR0Y528_HUSHU